MYLYSISVNRFSTCWIFNVRVFLLQYEQQWHPWIDLAMRIFIQIIELRIYNALITFQHLTSIIHEMQLRDDQSKEYIIEHVWEVDSIWNGKATQLAYFRYFPD